MRRIKSASILFLMTLIVANSFSPICLAFNIDSLDETLTNEISELVKTGDIPSLQVCVGGLCPRANT